MAGICFEGSCPSTSIANCGLGQSQNVKNFQMSIELCALVTVTGKNSKQFFVRSMKSGKNIRSPPATLSRGENNLGDFKGVGIGMLRGISLLSAN